MSFERDALMRSVQTGPVARVLVVETKGSVPRGPGTAMLVTTQAQSGTIGGGALEWEAARAAREVLATGRDRVLRLPLGPGLGQCCGGAVTLLIERWDAARAGALPGAGVVARPLPGGPEAMPLSVSRLLADARAAGSVPEVQMRDGWMVEPILSPVTDLWIWGAGHVGRAIVAVLAPLPDIAITWIDTDADRFPAALPDGVERVVARAPADLAAHAPRPAHHLILTYSHAIDLALCDALLSRGFGSCGLIGSDTKWARFRTRLQALGHAPAEIGRICCPIGDPSLGKHPQAIAIGVAATILRAGEQGEAMERLA